MIKKGLKWISNILTVLLLILLAILIYTKCVTTFSGSAYPNYFGYTLFEVASGSMEPELKVHDVVIVKIGNENVKKGDVVAYSSKDAIITHRILFMDQEKVTLKGDANNTIDEPITKNDIIGKVVFNCKELGIWKSIFMEPKVIIAMFITLILFDLTLSYKGKEKSNDTKIKQGKTEPTELVEPQEEVKMESIQEMSQEEKESLIDFTRKIDMNEINALLEEKKTSENEHTTPKVDSSNPVKEDSNKQEPKKIELSKKVRREELELPKLKKETAKIEYTTRLDLNEIQKRINKK